MEFFTTDLWNDLVSNALATLLGAVVGIPIALWLSNYQSKQEQKERKKKILRLLKEELEKNVDLLNQWEKLSDPFMIKCIHLLVFIKVKHWHAFSDGGELQWIRNPNLLGDIADAYNALRMLKDLCNRYFVILELEGIDPSEAALAEVKRLIERGIQDSLKEINIAINAINQVRQRLSDSQREGLMA